jgi:hypothetical protein
LQTRAIDGQWIESVMQKLIIVNKIYMTYKELSESYEIATDKKFEDFISSPAWQLLRENGLLIL